MHNAYGAADLLSSYCNLPTRFFRRAPVIWQHGWIPETQNSDVDLVVSESGETSELLDFSYLVSRTDQVTFLEQSGLPHVCALGLPFVYALDVFREREERKSGSLLVMPADERHRNERGEETSLDHEYIDFLRNLSGAHSEVLVLFRQSQIERGRDLLWRNSGFDVRPGAGEGDPKSLRKLVSIFSQFETMTSNGFSSAIPYAAASGCRVSIAGPRATFPSYLFFSGGLVRNRPELGAHYINFHRPEMLETVINNPELFRKPDEAVTAVDWGMEQIGGNHKKSSSELRAIFHQAIERSKADGPRRRSRKSFAIPVSVKSAMNLGRGSDDKKHVGLSATTFSNLVRSTQSNREASDFSVSTLGRSVLLRPRTADLRNANKYLYEKGLNSLDVGNPSRILDIGAHVGCSMLYLGHRFPAAQLAGAEAWKRNFELLERNLESHDGVQLVNAALWSETGTVAVLPALGKETTSTVTDYCEGLDAVGSLSLPDLFKKLEWHHANLVKMNIEGSEYPTLLSAQDQLADLCDVLLVKFHNTFARRREHEEVTGGLISRGATVEKVGEFTVFRFRD